MFRVSINFGRNDSQTINIYSLLIREASNQKWVDWRSNKDENLNILDALRH